MLLHMREDAWVAERVARHGCHGRIRSRLQLAGGSQDAPQHGLTSMTAGVGLWGQCDALVQGKAATEQPNKRRGPEHTESTRHKSSWRTTGKTLVAFMATLCNACTIALVIRASNAHVQHLAAERADRWILGQWHAVGRRAGRRRRRRRRQRLLRRQLLLAARVPPLQNLCSHSTALGVNVAGLNAC